VDALELVWEGRAQLETVPEALAMLKAMQPVSQEPIAYFDFQGKGFRWAQSVSIGEVPMIVKVEPMPLYSAPTHIGNVDSLYTSQERVKKLEENVQMLLYALEEISSMAGKSARAIARAAMLAMEKQT
jgi:hypothetical protein